MLGTTMRPTHADSQHKYLDHNNKHSGFTKGPISRLFKMSPWQFRSSFERMNNRKHSRCDSFESLARERMAMDRASQEWASTGMSQERANTSMSRGLPGRACDEGMFLPLRFRPILKPAGVFKRPRINVGSAFVPPTAWPEAPHREQAGHALEFLPCPLPAAKYQEPSSEFPESESSLLSPPLSPQLSAEKPSSSDSVLGSELLLPLSFTSRTRHVGRARAPQADAVPKLKFKEQAVPGSSPSPPPQLDAKAERHCISCFITDTPCWRPSWDVSLGQLCNSCGLRYRKTHIRCPSMECRNIPSKMDLAAIRARCLPGELECPKCETELVHD